MMNDFAKDVKKELVAMAMIGFKINMPACDEILNNAEEMSSYENMSVSECASLICDLTSIA